MKALEVCIDGQVVGLYVPPAGKTFAAMLGNIPRTYMRAHVTSGTDEESWKWQLPDVKEGQVISFRGISRSLSSRGAPPRSACAGRPASTAPSAPRRRH